MEKTQWVIVDVQLEQRRCFDCGRYYMVETARGSVCPYCAQARIDALVTERGALERSNSALRGVAKRGRR